LRGRWDEILSITDKHLEMIGNVKELRAQIDQYEGHVAVYKALRETGDRQTPRNVDDEIGWPRAFRPLMEQRTQELQAKLFDSMRFWRKRPSIYSPTKYLLRFFQRRGELHVRAGFNRHFS